MDDDEIFQATGLSPEETTVAAIREWARRLGSDRSDMEKAAQTLGRLRSIDPAIVLDLRRTNLQGFEFMDARMKGADLSGARIQRADLRGAAFDQSTNLRAETNRGSVLGSVDFTGIAVLEAFVIETFRDGSVTGLPARLVPGEGNLAHWAKEVLKTRVFYDRWRA